MFSELRVPARAVPHHHAAFDSFRRPYRYRRSSRRTARRPTGEPGRRQPLGDLPGRQVGPPDARPASGRRPSGRSRWPGTPRRAGRPQGPALIRPVRQPRRRRRHSSARDDVADPGSRTHRRRRPAGGHPLFSDPAAGRVRGQLGQLGPPLPDRLGVAPEHAGPRTRPRHGRGGQRLDGRVPPPVLLRSTTGRTAAPSARRLPRRPPCPRLPLRVEVAVPFGDLLPRPVRTGKLIRTRSLAGPLAGRGPRPQRGGQARRLNGPIGTATARPPPRSRRGRRPSPSPRPTRPGRGAWAAGSATPAPAASRGTG